MAQKTKEAKETVAKVLHKVRGIKASVYDVGAEGEFCKQQEQKVEKLCKSTDSYLLYSTKMLFETGDKENAAKIFRLSQKFKRYCPSPKMCEACVRLRQSKKEINEQL